MWKEVHFTVLICTGTLRDVKMSLLIHRRNYAGSTANPSAGERLDMRSHLYLNIELIYPNFLPRQCHTCSLLKCMEG